MECSDLVKYFIPNSSPIMAYFIPNLAMFSSSCKSLDLQIIAIGIFLENVKIKSSIIGSISITSQTITSKCSLPALSKDF
jgi:hypothetical protein